MRVCHRDHVARIVIAVIDVLEIVVNDLRQVAGQIVIECGRIGVGAVDLLNSIGASEAVQPITAGFVLFVRCDDPPWVCSILVIPFARAQWRSRITGAVGLADVGAAGVEGRINARAFL